MANRLSDRSTRALQLVRSGCTVAEAASATGASQSAIRRACQAAGVVPPKPAALAAPAAPMIPVTVKMRPNQRDKLQRIGPARLREWLDQVAE